MLAQNATAQSSSRGAPKQEKSIPPGTRAALLPELASGTHAVASGPLDIWALGTTSNLNRSLCGQRVPPAAATGSHRCLKHCRTRRGISGTAQAGTAVGEALWVRLLCPLISPDFESTEFLMRTEGFDVTPNTSKMLSAEKWGPCPLNSLCLTLLVCQMG